MKKQQFPSYTCTSRLTNYQREPLSRLTVRAYGQGLEIPDDFLREAVTDDESHYAIRFTEAQFKPGGKEHGESHD